MTKENKNQIIEKIKAATVEDAIAKVKELAEQKKRKFNESLDLAINLGIDAKQSSQAVKGSILLPNGSGKDVKVIVLTNNDDEAKAALAGGAKLAGLDEIVAKIEQGFVDFDCCIATPDVMPKIGKIARKLGPRGLMPSPKNGTVTKDIDKALKDALKGKIDFKNDKSGIIHCLVGKINFENKALIENIQTIVKTVKDAKPEGAKGKFIKAFYLNSTMGPSVEVAIDSL